MKPEVSLPTYHSPFLISRNDKVLSPLIRKIINCLSVRAQQDSTASFFVHLNIMLETTGQLQARFRLAVKVLGSTVPEKPFKRTAWLHQMRMLGKSDLSAWNAALLEARIDPNALFKLAEGRRHGSLNMLLPGLTQIAKTIERTLCDSLNPDSAFEPLLSRELAAVVSALSSLARHPCCAIVFGGPLMQLAFASIIDHDCLGNLDVIAGCTDLLHSCCPAIQAQIADNHAGQLVVILPGMISTLQGQLSTVFRDGPTIEAELCVLKLCSWLSATASAPVWQEAIANNMEPWMAITQKCLLSSKPTLHSIAVGICTTITNLLEDIKRRGKSKLDADDLFSWASLAATTYPAVSTNCCSKLLKLQAQVILALNDSDQEQLSKALQYREAKAHRLLEEGCQKLAKLAEAVDQNLVLLSATKVQQPILELHRSIESMVSSLECVLPPGLRSIEVNISKNLDEFLVSLPQRLRSSDKLLSSFNFDAIVRGAIGLTSDQLVEGAVSSAEDALVAGFKGSLMVLTSDLRKNWHRDMQVPEDVLVAVRCIASSRASSLLNASEVRGTLQGISNLIQSSHSLERTFTSCLATVATDAKHLLADVDSTWSCLSQTVCQNLKLASADVQQQLFGLVSSGIGGEIQGLKSLGGAVKDLTRALGLSKQGSKMIFEHFLARGFNIKLDAKSLTSILKLIGVVVPGLDAAITVLAVLDQVVG
eukprot:m.3629 g.3629  ORF g.3629 m.3629 type:complete len:707 (-) comp6238_c0_seq1:92-2212(-)